MVHKTQIPDAIGFDITSIDEDETSSKEVLGYYLISTATIHVEDTPEKPNKKAVEKEIEKIVSHLISSSNPQLTIAIHGYGTTKYEAEKRYNDIYKYANIINIPNNVFIGYRWPAENPVKDDLEAGNNKSSTFLDKVHIAFQALPSLLLGIFISTLVLSIVTVFLDLTQNSKFNFIGVFISIALAASILSFLLSKIGDAETFLPLIPNRFILILFACLIGAIATHTITTPINSSSLLVVLIILFVLFFGVVLTLIGLRLSTYPSDRYRAQNYGVMDLVEFIRQLDQAVIEKACAQASVPKDQLLNIKSIEDEPINASRIRLSFIGHSLGCDLVTQTIRILSDVFDPKAIGNPHENLVNKEPPSNIGRVFKLGRLVLVAPDIPIESILSDRANFLRVSLRRCEEVYVFSNEADLALRVASTSVNYFSFPAKTRFRSYKLGNVTVKRFTNKFDFRNRKLKNDEYGIVNLHTSEDNQPHKNLEVRASNLEHRTLEELINLSNKKKKFIFPEEAVADFLTYFDCTDYVDFQGNSIELESRNRKEKGIVSYASRKSALNLWIDYISLGLAYFFSFPRYINVHGGYFDGEFSQQLIYEIAFLGFQRFLSKNCNGSLDVFSQHCQNKGIQVILASKALPKSPQQGASPE